MVQKAEELEVNFHCHVLTVSEFLNMFPTCYTALENTYNQVSFP